MTERSRLNDAQACPLLKVNRTPWLRRGNDAIDPKRTLAMTRSITDDELMFTNPRTPAGVTLELVFKGAK